MEVRARPEAAWQPASARPLLVTTLPRSDLQPRQTVTAACLSATAPTCLAGPGRGALAQLSGTRTAAGPSPGSQVQPGGPTKAWAPPRCHCTSLKSKASLGGRRRTVDDPRPRHPVSAPL